MNDKQALSDLKILEYSHLASGPFCAKVMADLGAEVVKIEEPGKGDEARNHGPFPEDRPHPEKSALFLHLNTNKLGITLNLRHPLGKKLFLQLVEQADIFIENNPPKLMQELEFDYEHLMKINPRLIMTSITSFGQTGPYRDYKTTELISFHMGGVGYETPINQVTDPEREPPLKAAGHQANLLAGWTGATATMAAVFARQTTGRGQHIDISEQDAVANMIRPNFSRYSYAHEIANREKRGLPWILPCKGGHISFSPQGDRFWRGLMEMLGNPEWARNEKFKDFTTRREHVDEMEGHIIEWTMQRTKEEIFEKAQAHHIPCFPVNSMSEVFRAEQFKAREFFVEIDHPVAGKFQFPGAPYKLSTSPWQIRRPAPLLGEHNEEIFCKRLGYKREELVKLRMNGVI